MIKQVGRSRAVPSALLRFGLVSVSVELSLLEGGNERNVPHRVLLQHLLILWFSQHSRLLEYSAWKPGKGGELGGE